MAGEQVAEKLEQLVLNENDRSTPSSQLAAAAPTGKKGKKIATDDTRPLQMDPRPAYIQHRIEMFDKLKAKYHQDIIAKPHQTITVTLPDGTQKSAVAWHTSPMDIAKDISTSLAGRIVAAHVDGKLWDATRPLEKDCSLELLDFENEAGKEVFWHSSAHVLGEACELRFGCDLCIGPHTEDGFYYEMSMPCGVTQADYPALETLIKNVAKEKQPFERLVISKADLLEMFQHNRFKVELIQKKVEEGTSSTVYRCGPFIDLCLGPHLPDTGRIKSIMITKNSSSYWLGDSKNESLQRIYGVTFPSAKEMTEYKKFIEEAAKRDHRKIGKEQELFFFHELSPGSCFFLPHGARIYNTLVDFIKAEYHKRGFTEVVTPNVYNVKLWETSGHWQNYQENMFSFDIEKEKFALKPMNCPGHCVMFGHRDRSYRELPIRLADFGVLHRNELSGALSGLTRVRRFQQDDAHIFCRPDQLESEMDSCLDFLKHVYGIFGFSFSLKLSTRPEKFLGDVDTWNLAEQKLAQSLDKFGHAWELNPGDGAFYGPKIDITIKDALGRRFQCATIQLDFQLPERFNLEYNPATSEENKKYRPVIIHRAILGSVERMIAILTENYGGKWPYWLSPRQIAIVPVAHPHFEYAERIRGLLHDAGFHVDADLSDNTLSKKIRNAEVAQYNFIFVVGSEEVEGESVNVRNRDATEKGKAVAFKVADVLPKLLRLHKEKRTDNALI